MLPEMPFHALSSQRLCQQAKLLILAKLFHTWNDCLFAPDRSWKVFKRAFTYKFASHLMKNVAKN